MSSNNEFQRFSEFILTSSKNTFGYNIFRDFIIACLYRKYKPENNNLKIISSNPQLEMLSSESNSRVYGPTLSRITWLRPRLGFELASFTALCRLLIKTRKTSFNPDNPILLTWFADGFRKHTDETLFDRYSGWLSLKSSTFKINSSSPTIGIPPHNILPVHKQLKQVLNLKNSIQKTSFQYHDLIECYGKISTILKYSNNPKTNQKLSTYIKRFESCKNLTIDGIDIRFLFQKLLHLLPKHEMVSWYIGHCFKKWEEKNNPHHKDRFQILCPLFELVTCLDLVKNANKEHHMFGLEHSFPYFDYFPFSFSSQEIEKRNNIPETILSNSKESLLVAQMQGSKHTDYRWFGNYLETDIINTDSPENSSSKEQILLALPLENSKHFIHTVLESLKLLKCKHRITVRPHPLSDHESILQTLNSYNSSLNIALDQNSLLAENLKNSFLTVSWLTSVSQISLKAGCFSLEYKEPGRINFSAPYTSDVPEKGYYTFESMSECVEKLGIILQEHPVKPEPARQHGNRYKLEEMSNSFKDIFKNL